jgi:hypothetical protein
MKRKNVLLLIASVLVSIFGWSQTGIGVESPNDEAVLEIASSTKGVLLPKVALENNAQSFHLTDNAGAAHTGMLLYNTNTDITGGLSGAGYYFWTGVQWERLLTSDGSSNIFFPDPGIFDLTQPQPTSAVLGVLSNFPQGRLRLTVGPIDTFDDSLGASIDLHGNQATSNTGVLDLVAGSAASATNNAIRFWTNSDGLSTGQGTRMVITGNGNVGIGNTAPNANAILDLTNTDDDKALLLPVVTASANVTTPTAGMVVYDNTNNNMLVYNGAEWIESFNKVVTNEMIFDGIDEGSVTYDNFYYVSMLINNAWQVTRYSRSNVNEEKIANIGNNSSQTTQPTTVADCVALNYQAQ